MKLTQWKAMQKVLLRQITKLEGEPFEEVRQIQSLLTVTLGAVDAEVVRLEKEKKGGDLECHSLRD